MFTMVAALVGAAMILVGGLGLLRLALSPALSAVDPTRRWLPALRSLLLLAGVTAMVLAAAIARYAT